MTALTVAITTLAALVFLAAAVLKFRHDPTVMATRDDLGIAPGPYTMIGVCEVAGAAGALLGLAFRPLGIAALTGLVLIAVGACAVQVRLRHPLNEAASAILALGLSFGALSLQFVSA